MPLVKDVIISRLVRLEEKRKRVVINDVLRQLRENKKLVEESKKGEALERNICLVHPAVILARKAGKPYTDMCHLLGLGDLASLPLEPQWVLCVQIQPVLYSWQQQQQQQPWLAVQHTQDRIPEASAEHGIRPEHRSFEGVGAQPGNAGLSAEMSWSAPRPGWLGPSGFAIHAPTVFSHSLPCIQPVPQRWPGEPSWPGQSAAAVAGCSDPAQRSASEVAGGGGWNMMNAPAPAHGPVVLSTHALVELRSYPGDIYGSPSPQPPA